MSFDARRRWATWAEHIVEQVDRLHASLGDPVETERLEIGLNAEGAIRCLEVINEASARLYRAGVPLAELEPDIEWSRVRGFGNIARHDYPDVEMGQVENTLLHGLKPLRAAALRLKARFEAEAS